MTYEIPTLVSVEEAASEARRLEAQLARESHLMSMREIRSVVEHLRAARERVAELTGRPSPERPTPHP